MIAIRQLRPEDDLKAVVSLCRDFFAEYEARHREFFDTYNLTDADISGRFLESMTSNSSATFIALIDDSIVGYALVAIREQPRFYKIKKIGAVSGLMVAKEHRRKGVASRLLTEAKAYCRRNGIKYFTLYTAVANKAAGRFYEQNGMTALHTTFIGET